MDRTKVMAKITYLHVIGASPDGEVLPMPEVIGLVRQLGGVVNYTGQITGFRATAESEGPEYVEVDCSDEPFEVLLRLVNGGELQSFHCMVPSDGIERYFMFEVCSDGVAITMLSNQKLLPDGTVDFNWQYNFWVPKFRALMLVEGVKICELY